MKRTYTHELLGFMNIFDKATNVKLEDCFIDKNNLLHFVVPAHEIGRAIGKQGIKVKIIESALQRKIKIMPYSPEIVEFIKGVISPLRVDGITQEGEECVITSADRSVKAQLIGRSGMNLRALEEIVKRYFKITHIRVE